MKHIVAAFALLALAACAPSGIPQPTKVQQPSDHCASLFITAIATPDGKAAGTWDCLAEPSREDFFLRFGWSNDASVGHWIEQHFGGATQHVDAYVGNPVVVKDTNGTQRKAYLYRLSIIQDDGTWDATSADAATGLTIVVDSTGRVLEVD